MTRPDLNGPDDYENPDYNFTANRPNPATSGLSQFSQFTRADWENFEAGKWQGKTEGIGQGVDLQRTIVSAIVLAFKGDIGGLVALFGDTIQELITSSTIYKVITGATSGLTGLLASAAGLMGIRWAQVDQHTVDIEAAMEAALAANNRVDALITGGERTIYTSSTTWVKPTTPFTKIGVICIGAGGGALSAQWREQGDRAIGGGYTYVEIPASNLPATVAITVPGATPKDHPAPQPSTFGTYVSSPNDGSGAKIESSGRSEAMLSAPAKGQPGARVGENGPSSAIAQGGIAQSGQNGTPGGNAPVDGIDLTGGAGGGGGQGASSGGISVGTAYNGGGGGFPGGPGGQGGRFTPGGNDGGPGGQGLVAVIVF